MVSRYEWLDRQTEENPPEQYNAIISALGDWIEAELEFGAAIRDDNATWFEARVRALAKKADAKRRAIGAGYVWRLDLDPNTALAAAAERSTGNPSGQLASEASSDGEASRPVGLPTSTAERGAGQEPVAFDLLAHIRRAIAFSERTFGPGARTKGVLDHIRKELIEVEDAPHDLEEWVDVWMLALDGAWRAGYTPAEICAAIDAKQTKNEGRTWPDWRMMDPDKGIQHDRSAASTPQPSTAEGSVPEEWTRLADELLSGVPESIYTTHWVQTALKLLHQIAAPSSGKGEK